MELTTTRFRGIQMKCCSTIISWLGSRDPNYCPECGTKTTMSKDHKGFTTLLETIVRMEDTKK